MIHPKTRMLAQDRGYELLERATEPFTLWTGQGIGESGLLVVAPSEAVSVRLINGLEIKCSPTQKFKTLNKNDRKVASTMAKDLTSNHLVHLTEKTPEFDYLDLECYNYLNRLTSEEAGTLVGLSHNIGIEKPDLPKIRKETVTELDRLLAKMQVLHVKERYYKRTDRFRYKIQDEDYINELQGFINVSDNFWKSKLFLRGYLKAMFTFATIGKAMFTLRAVKGSSFLKEVQQALLLFGVNSSYSNGLKMSQLIVFKNNCYRFSYYIGIFNAENLFKGVDFKRFLKYKDRTTSEMRYSRVTAVDKIGTDNLVELNASQFMANGVILENYE